MSLLRRLPAAYQHEYTQVEHPKVVTLWSSDFILWAPEAMEGFPACQKQDFRKIKRTAIFRQEWEGERLKAGRQDGKEEAWDNMDDRNFGAVRHFPQKVTRLVGNRGITAVNELKNKQHANVVQVLISLTNPFVLLHLWNYFLKHQRGVYKKSNKQSQILPVNNRVLIAL